ncbi:MAG TPA: hypothetical protein VGF56_09695 [Rhizomicrobium sp.]|jgi:hypothetical protein
MPRPDPPVKAPHLRGVQPGAECVPVARLPAALAGEFHSAELFFSFFTRGEFYSVYSF